MALHQGIKNLFGPLLMTWTADSPTPRLADTGSRRLPDSPMRGVVDTPTQPYGESIFDYEYLYEFEFESYADLNYAKTSENSVHCHVPLIKFFWVNGRY